ncbi:YcbK family protein [Candidatus Tokpelaia sp.]|uniref:YcbK family protein n=1 Tax=Candidatus Tokpelaia sp. TaxID=2233777 RepID=UPI00123894EA|nr:D-Ala-D-Ala carboxypeptidase family metallohydrolase [Candidatus Tokpelaia sp.]KAA6404822.1 hypothetical protein DPQ22_07860 [Candidatus Tokpelaia sp.]
MALIQKHRTGANSKFAAKDESNQKTGCKAGRSIAGFAHIATIIAVASALAPANAQALVASGNFGKTIKKTAPKRRSVTNTNPTLPDSYRPGKTEAAIIPASLGGMARSTQRGVYTASPNISTHCFRPRLVALLAGIHYKYHRPVIVTSGYRGSVHNARAGGVRDSLHIACAAADIKVPGIDKYQLAGFVRSLPNRGGVGLYCHQAVHVDIGTPREWNWCGSRKH